MKKNYYIRGCYLNPEKVITELMKLGGKNIHNLRGWDNAFYFIDSDGTINCVADNHPLVKCMKSHPDWEEVFLEPNFVFSEFDRVNYRGEMCLIEGCVNVEGAPCYLLENHPGEIISEYLLVLGMQVKSWRDMERGNTVIAGYNVLNTGVEEAEKRICSKNTVNIYRTIEQAKSAIAFAMISQLMGYYNGPVRFGVAAWCLSIGADQHGNIIPIISESWGNGGILRFHTRGDAELFLANNEQLVRDYLMIK